ncbi:hypothetical protein [Croceicoccus naphthovorans]|uniref:Uncharacterized protein n=1 Tax=Croceicoccus naphthovorans TaxID=1348774 RepID=A0A0G3XEA1_9SPHN|nr:hypothetical protein [Croceicoccus naphthovorans]AKM09875.1 hypothetical protein AB433_07575 [Croceicoccus naphthovorans]MBB3991334.1 hypothetical protein [Croceicoccus naphthovorans]
MASVRMQIYAAVKAKLDAVRSALAFNGVIVNPREPIGVDQMDALILMHGGDRDPNWLTGGIEDRWLEIGVGWMLRETTEGSAEEQLDAALVAVCDALTDPDDVQLGGLAVEVMLTGIEEPQIGRAADGAHVLAGQFCEFAVRYMTREGDASTPAP